VRVPLCRSSLSCSVLFAASCCCSVDFVSCCDRLRWLIMLSLMFLNLLICCHMMHNFIFLSYYILFIIITPNAQLSPNRRHVDWSTQIFELDSTRLNEI
jgi:hypothetical protein